MQLDAQVACNMFVSETWSLFVYSLWFPEDIRFACVASVCVLPCTAWQEDLEGLAWRMTGFIVDLRENPAGAVCSWVPSAVPEANSIRQSENSACVGSKCCTSWFEDCRLKACLLLEMQGQKSFFTTSLSNKILHLEVATWCCRRAPHIADCWA